MLHYVRGDGGMIVIPKEELVRWLEGKFVSASMCYPGSDARIRNLVIHDMLDELEAMGK